LSQTNHNTECCVKYLFEFTVLMGAVDFALEVMERERELAIKKNRKQWGKFGCIDESYSPGHALDAPHVIVRVDNPVTYTYISLNREVFKMNDLLGFDVLHI
jgi:hypothetical protein